jgi:hypothetical protein
MDNELSFYDEIDQLRRKIESLEWRVGDLEAEMEHFARRLEGYPIASWEDDEPCSLGDTNTTED